MKPPPMKVSDLIAILERTKAEHGDLTFCTEDGPILSAGAYPCHDGVQTIAGEPRGEPNEIVVHFALDSI